uniref:Uncharacterized protein n=1 Tax=Parascaris equorum TaxID=6256 RepID=A0A914RHA5_PAREQ
MAMFRELQVLHIALLHLYKKRETYCQKRGGKELHAAVRYSMMCNSKLSTGPPPPAALRQCGSCEQCMLLHALSRESRGCVGFSGRRAAFSSF